MNLFRVFVIIQLLESSDLCGTGAEENTLKLKRSASSGMRNFRDPTVAVGFRVFDMEYGRTSGQSYWSKSLGLLCLFAIVTYMFQPHLYCGTDK
jgi:hypothetical protein